MTKKQTKITGFPHIQHTVPAVQHHCLSLWIQMYCSQGHPSSPHTLELLLAHGRLLYVTIWCHCIQGNVITFSKAEHIYRLNVRDLVTEIQ